MTSRERRNLFTGLAFISPWLVGLGVFTAYPVFASLFYSFCDYSVLQAPDWAGLDNYHRLAGDALFWTALKNTFIYAVFSIPLGMLVALSLALLLNCRVVGTPLFRTVFFLPSIVPVVASSLLWLWIFNGNYGLLNSFLGPVFRLAGSPPPGWLADPAWAMPALILMNLWGVGNSMVIYLAGLQNVPKELYESADIDGAGSWSRFRHVTLPVLSPVLYFNLIMGIIGALQVFTQAFVMTGGAAGAPERSTLLYTTYLFSTAFFDLRMGYASAMAWVLFAITVLLAVAATKLVGKRIHYSG